MTQYFIYRGGGRGVPLNVTHVRVHKSVTVIPAYLFIDHPSIVELICHAGVKIIKEGALCGCRRLRRVIIPGVEVLEGCAFDECADLTYVQCKKLERIERCAFRGCTSLSSINLLSVKTVERYAFSFCRAMTDAEFGSDLELIEVGAFAPATSLHHITIPLKDDVIEYDDPDETVFNGCDHLNHVDLVEGAILQETIDTLLFDEWRNDMNQEINSIHQILHDAPAGGSRYDDLGEKAVVIREWITHVLDKIFDYKVEHRRIVNEAVAVLQVALPEDVVMNNVAPFLQLPSHNFDGEVEDKIRASSYDPPPYDAIGW